jgi:hypothetical protein
MADGGFPDDVMDIEILRPRMGLEMGPAALTAGLVDSRGGRYAATSNQTR